MVCIFRISGQELDVETLVRLSPVEPCAVFKRGEPVSTRPNSRHAQISGVNLEISDANFDDLQRQQADAIAFLRTHASALLEMRGLVGVERASLGFGIAMRDVVVQSDAFTAELIALIAPLRCSLEISQYPVSETSRNIRRYRKALRGAF
jgi:hypothetical protein